jgi:hypothetical protein
VLESGEGVGVEPVFCEPPDADVSARHVPERAGAENGEGRPPVYRGKKRCSSSTQILSGLFSVRFDVQLPVARERGVFDFLLVLKEVECVCDFDWGAMESTRQIFFTHDDIAGWVFLVCFSCVVCDLLRKLFEFFLLPLLVVFSAKT